MTPEQLYQVERERALQQGKRVLLRRGDVAQKIDGQATDSQLAEAKRQFDELSKQKTHRSNRNL